MNQIFTFFQKAILSFAVIGFISAGKTEAQNFKTNQVIIASSGTFGNPNNYVHVGSYDPTSKIYTVFDSIRTTSTKNILIEDKYAYVTGDTIIVKYDIDNYTRLATGKSSALNSPGGHLVSYGDFILATRGFGASDNYVIVYNKSDLSEAFKIGGISNQSAGIVVVGDSAYVAVQGPYGYDTGKIAVIDLKARMLKREINLDTLGATINKVFTDGTNIYAVSAKRSVITTINIASGAMSNKIGYAAGSSGNGLALANGILYTDFSNAGIGSYNLAADSVLNPRIITYANIPGVTSQYSLGGMALDTISGQFYITVSDYFSYGNAYVLNRNGQITDTFAVGISPEAIAIDYRSTVGIKDANIKLLSINAYPNPAKNALHIDLNGLTNPQLIISDLSGKMLMKQTASNTNGRITVNIESLPQGMYILNLNSAAGNGFTKFIKQ